MSEYVNLVIFQLNGLPLVVPVDKNEQNAYAQHVLKAIDNNKTLVFHEGEGKNRAVAGAIRGMAIISFNFEPLPKSTNSNNSKRDLEVELMQLQKRQLQENIKNLERMNSGDDWKSNGF